MEQNWSRATRARGAPLSLRRHLPGEPGREGVYTRRFWFAKVEAGGEDVRRDWERIRAEYITGTETLRQLAERLKIPFSTVFNRASRDGWVEAKEEEKARIQASVQAKAREKRIKREAAALERVETQIERLLEEIERALADPVQLYRHILYTERGIQGEVELGKLDTKSARDIMSILADMKASLEGMGGILDKRTAEEIRLKKARLKLDQRKAGLEGKADDESTGVVILPAVDDGPVEEIEIGGEEENLSVAAATSPLSGETGRDEAAR